MGVSNVDAFEGDHHYRRSDRNDCNQDSSDSVDDDRDYRVFGILPYSWCTLLLGGNEFVDVESNQM